MMFIVNVDICYIWRLPFLEEEKRLVTEHHI